jgi:hypothetical protein
MTLFVTLFLSLLAPFGDLVAPRSGAAPVASALCSDDERREVGDAVIRHARRRGSPAGAAFVEDWLRRRGAACFHNGSEIALRASACPGGTFGAVARRGPAGWEVRSLFASANPQCMNSEFVFDFGFDGRGRDYRR